MLLNLFFSRRISKHHSKHVLSYLLDFYGFDVMYKFEYDKVIYIQSFSELGVKTISEQVMSYHLYFIQHSINLFTFILVWFRYWTRFWYVAIVVKMTINWNLGLAAWWHSGVRKISNIRKNFNQPISYSYSKYISKPFWHVTIISHQLMCKNHWKYIQIWLT